MTQMTYTLHNSTAPKDRLSGRAPLLGPAVFVVLSVPLGAALWFRIALVLAGIG